MKLLLISNSTNYKESYLGWCLPLIEEFLKNEQKNILFLPYAGVKINNTPYPESYDIYLEEIKNTFAPLGLNVLSIHEAESPVKAVEQAQAIMVGGGNTFHLVAEIHNHNLIEPIRRKVREGIPYIGWSAGANVACPRLCTTNDMPIVMPKSFDCFDFVPFQINPHFMNPYTEEVKDLLKHNGESRKERLEEFLAVNQEITVAGLREASAFWIENERITLCGKNNLCVMKFGGIPKEYKPSTENAKAIFDFGLNPIKEN